MRLVYTMTLLFLACYMNVGQLAGQTEYRALKIMESSLVSGSTDGLPQFLSQEVGITMGGTTRIYDKNQALFVIRQFMSDYPPGNFNLQHTGKSGRTAYASGLYSSRTGGSFEINIFVGVTGGTIDEIRFDRS